jgi:hypothetical protein
MFHLRRGCSSGLVGFLDEIEIGRDEASGTGRRGTMSKLSEVITAPSLARLRSLFTPRDIIFP